MVDLIAQEQHTSENEGDSFTEVPHWYARRKQQRGLKHPVSIASSIADDNFFSNLLVEGKEDGLEDGDEDEDYTGTDSDLGSVSWFCCFLLFSPLFSLMSPIPSCFLPFPLCLYFLV